MSWQDLLEANEHLLGDGAMGTMLHQEGLQIGQAPETLNVDRPEAVKNVHLAYLEAGSQFVETNSFGGSPLKLARYDLNNN
mgnify:FL=1